MPFSSQTFKRLWPTKQELAITFEPDTPKSPGWRRRLATICLVIFLLAIGVRLFHWQDNRQIFPTLFSGMVEHYKSDARPLLNGDVAGFITGPAPPGDANILTYPPGYSLILGVVFKVFGESDAAMRLLQILCDAAAAVVLFLIAAELLPTRAAAIAGVLSALSPQLAYYSVILIPDSLATLPILLGIYFTVRARNSNRIRDVVAAGAFVGVSCWLRSNTLFLAPFLAVLLFLVMDRERRRRAALTLVAVTLLVIAPITIRNLVVFHHFVPLSLGVGQMLCFGIADFDKERKFGLPGTDIEIVNAEAKLYNRPARTGWLFGVDGIQRDRHRTAQALAVVRAHPVWFAGVVLRRAASMLRLERVHRIVIRPGVMSRLELQGNAQPAWSSAPADLLAQGLLDQRAPVKTEAQPSLSTDGQTLNVDSDAPDLKYQIVASPIAVQQNTDYLLRVPIFVEHGNVTIDITNPEGTESYGSTPILNPAERLDPSDQTPAVHQVLFVSRGTDLVSLVLKNGRRGGKTLVRLGTPELFRLGPASFLWTRYIRVLFHYAQLFFLTAWILPLAIFGIALLWLARRGRDLLLLLAVPAYYVCFQSFLHTEYRYVLAAQPFLYLLAGVSLYFSLALSLRLISKSDEVRS
ncbi:MAG TPA: glycosyltransferase family 39 protein [Pyrinomonadaceae bacterium]|nr:glycosyltransferase family 39 protein [Pyrinomonadaceae bacterium]